MTVLATEKQASFLRRLAGERDLSGLTDDQRATLEAPENLTKVQASTAIGILLEFPKMERIAAPALEPGMYRKDGTIYKVQVAVHGSGKPYAKELAQNDDGSWSFVYAAGMAYKLTNADALTLEEAKEFGALYGTCCVCGRTLTNEESIEAGIGPICAEKF